MPRPRRHRCVQSAFEYDYFKPCVICRQDADEVVLKMEEMESVRLKDYLGIDQRDAASQMEVSQPTFHRILTEARSKIACALVCGRPIRIRGGTCRMARHQQESSSATTANTNGRKRMAQEDRRTARNAGAQICTGQRMIAAMPEAAWVDTDAKMAL